MQKIEVVVRITKDHCPPQEQTIFEWFDQMRNPTDVLKTSGLEINSEHLRVFKHGMEVYMSRYEYGVLSLMTQHAGVGRGYSDHPEYRGPCRHRDD